MHKGQVVAYESRKIHPYEANYAPHYLEPVVIVHSLQFWRHYQLIKPFEPRTNNQGLEYIFTQPNLNAC